jgi:peptide/nickel transport system permease protein
MTAAIQTRSPRLPKLAIAVLAVAVLAGLLAPVLAPSDPREPSSDRLQSPSLDHLMGTDALGRDLLSLTLYALRTDLSLILLVTAAPMVIGTILGAVVGYLGGLLDAAFRWLADIMQALPAYLLLLALVFAMGPGTTSLVTAFAVMGWVTYARLIRTEVQRTKEREYVQAAYLSGLSRVHVLVRHVLPNSLTQTLVFFTTDLGMALQAIAVLSYFGLGVPPETPELGAMVADGQLLLRTHWWLSGVPGLIIIVLGVSIAVVGDRLRDQREEPR